MQVMTLHRIDRWDGGERNLPTPYHFRDPAIAKQVAGAHDHVSQVELIICESAEEMAQAEQANQIQRALGKLTPKERSAIGLPPDLGSAVTAVLDRTQADKESQS